MSLVQGLSVAASLLTAFAAWAAIASPRAKAVRREGRERRRREAEVHAALFGVPARRDDADALMSAAKPGLIANMEVVLAKLNAPLLNGKGDDLIRTVSRLDSRLTRIERQLRQEQS